VASAEIDFEHLRRNPPGRMSEREVVVVLNVCPRSIRNFTARRILPVTHLGRRRLFRRDAVWAALQALESGGSGVSRFIAAAPLGFECRNLPKMVTMGFRRHGRGE
jgi:hypothetical protein